MSITAWWVDAVDPNIGNPTRKGELTAVGDASSFMMASLNLSLQSSIRPIYGTQNGTRNQIKWTCSSAS